MSVITVIDSAVITIIDGLGSLPQDSQRQTLAAGRKGNKLLLVYWFHGSRVPLSSSSPGLWECGKRGVCGAFSKPLWESRPKGAISKVLWEPVERRPESSRAAFQAKRQASTRPAEAAFPQAFAISTMPNKEISLHVEKNST